MEPGIELRGYRSERLGAVDHEPTVRVCRCQRQERFPNPFVEANALLFESIGWPIDPGEADAGGDIKKHVHIGPRVTDPRTRTSRVRRRCQALDQHLDTPTMS